MIPADAVTIREAAQLLGLDEVTLSHLAEDRQRDDKGVVAGGERQILADEAAGVPGDVDRLRHGRQAFPQEDEIGGVAADIGRRCGRHRDMGRGKRGRVVQSVADHQDLPPGCRERGDARDLPARRDARDIRKAERLLGWTPKVSTAEGVGRLIAWVRENRSLFESAGS